MYTCYHYKSKWNACEVIRGTLLNISFCAQIDLWEVDVWRETPRVRIQIATSQSLAFVFVRLTCVRRENSQVWCLCFKNKARHFHQFVNSWILLNFCSQQKCNIQLYYCPTVTVGEKSLIFLQTMFLIYSGRNYILTKRQTCGTEKLHQLINLISPISHGKNRTISFGPSRKHAMHILKPPAVRVFYSLINSGPIHSVLWRK